MKICFTLRSFRHTNTFGADPFNGNDYWKLCTQVGFGWGQEYSEAIKPSGQKATFDFWRSFVETPESRAARGAKSPAGPEGVFFNAQPDWYAEIDGKRKHERAQLCLTNEEMTQELIENVLETLRKNPDAKIIDVSQNDWHGFCACEKCKAIDDAEGWNGKSVRMGTKVDWNTSYTPPVRGKYRLLASLRCEGTIKEGKLGSWGVYDAQGKKSLKSTVLDCRDFATADGSLDRKFRWLDLGVIDFVPGAYFWFAHGHHPELDAIFVDRVVAIGAE